MKVYFAGKVDKNDWRHRIAPSIRRLAGSHDTLDQDVLYSFPIETEYNGILYAGPFVIGCDHGCYHGEKTHGCGVEQGTCASQGEVSREQIVFWCTSMIDAADAFFAWIDSTDCYGTLAEIGYAHARGKPIFLSISPRLGEEYAELWFIRKMAKEVLHIGDPVRGFEQFLRGRSFETAQK